MNTQKNTNSSDKMSEALHRVQEEQDQITRDRNRMNDLYDLYARETDPAKKAIINAELVKLEDIFYPGDPRIVINY